MKRPRGSTGSRGRGTGRRGCAVLAAALALGACGGDTDTPVAGQDLLEMQADMVTYDMDTYFTNAQGIRTGKITADSAFFFEDSTVVHMQGVEMEVYAENGAVRAVVNADRGRFEEREQRMHALGDVVLVMPEEGRQLESAELHYDPVTEEIWSDSASTYRHDGQVTRGTCFKSDMSFRNYTVCNIRGSAEIGGG